jgi:hypothetical protein
MIPALVYPGILIPLNLDPKPFVDQDAVVSLFNPAIKEHQILHLAMDVLKPSIIRAFLSRGLLIEKVDVWRWSLTQAATAQPHTDGDFEKNNGRQVGINWSLFDDTSGVEFYNTNDGQTVYEQVPDGRHHTFWNFPKDTQPLVTWYGKYPSLINPQTPHFIIGPHGSYRHSVTIKIKDNPSYEDVLKKMWDLRIDHDFWPADISSDIVNRINSIVTRLENTHDLKIPQGNMSAYNVPKDLELIAIFSKFCKKPIKSFRIFKYKAGASANMHIDYDSHIKQFPAYALNIPLYGSDKCEINFYKNMGEFSEVMDPHAGSKMIPTDDSLVYPSSTLHITSPHLIRINVPHEVQIRNNAERKVLSVRFVDNELDNPTDIISNIKLAIK